MWPLLVLFSPLYPYYFVWKKSFETGQLISITASGMDNYLNLPNDDETKANVDADRFTYVVSGFVAGGVYYSSRSMLTFSFLETIASRQNTNSTNPQQPEAAAELARRWQTLWPKLLRVMLRGSVAATFAGVVHPFVRKLMLQK